MGDRQEAMRMVERSRAKKTNFSLVHGRNVEQDKQRQRDLHRPGLLHALARKT